MNKSPSYKERFEGYSDALSAAGVSLSSCWVNQENDEVEEKLKRYIQSLSSLPDAWFCVNDHYGFLLKQILTNLGHKIPMQFSICGFDDSLFATLSSPQLTTMAVDKEYFAKRSVIQLYNRMEQPELVFEKILLSTKLTKRETVKP